MARHLTVACVHTGRGGGAPGGRLLCEGEEPGGVHARDGGEVLE